MNKKIYKIIFVCILLVFVDQLTKYIFKSANIIVINNILYFKYVENIGVAFGLFKSAFNIYINLIMFLTLVFLWIVSFKKLKSNSSFIFLVSGCLSNLIDRICNGFVIDFIKISNFKFVPVFNLADVFLIIGFVFLVIEYLRKKDGNFCI